jgi:GT2 family glycosyltransferase
MSYSGALCLSIVIYGNGWGDLIRHFMYGEDEDLCIRAQHMGARPTFTPTATIVHYGASSEPSDAEKQIKMMAGKITVINRHWSRVSAFIGRLLFLMMPHPRWVIYGLLGLIIGRANLRRKAALWWQVWRGRRRWMNGWR